MIRALDPADAAAYQGLRLRALREHPEAFGAAYEDEAGVGLEQVAAQMGAGAPLTLYAGASLDAGLVGMLVLSRYPRAKLRHRATLSSMYVAPEARGRGVGAALLGFALDHARAQDGLEDLTLAVTVGNEAARRLYLAAGFRPYGVEPRLIKLGGRAFDVEWMHLRLG